MKPLLVPLTAAILLGGCTSAAAPGADNVVNQVDKAERLEDQVEERNAEFDETP